MNQASKLRTLLNQPGPIVAPGVYDCLSAKIVERCGYPAAFISGAAVTASVLGYPDVGLQTMPEILNQSRNMARCVDIPLIIEIDTGYGNALNLIRAVREFERAGLAGIFFEDQTFPKRCGHFEGKQVISIEEMVVKIKAACEARTSQDFVIIARSDARAIHGLDHAIERGNQYAAAGADLIFIEALLSEAEMRRVGEAIQAPLQANISEAGKTPVLPFAQLYEMGFKLISYSGLLQRSAIRGMLDVLDILGKEGSTASAYPARLCSLVERSEILGLEHFYALEERLYGPIMDSEGSWRDTLKHQASKAAAGANDKIPI